MSNGSTQYQKLENRLLLLSWLNSLLGYEKNRELLEDLKQAEEGFDAQGRSHIYYRLISRGSKLKISADDLARYDDNIRAHLAVINARRTQPITLRYFQYLAALYTEIVLDRLVQPQSATPGRLERLCVPAQHKEIARRTAGRALH
jgi:hypothetical protein